MFFSGHKCVAQAEKARDGVTGKGAGYAVSGVHERYCQCDSRQRIDRYRNGKSDEILSALQDSSHSGHQKADPESAGRRDDRSGAGKMQISGDLGAECDCREDDQNSQAPYIFKYGLAMSLLGTTNVVVTYRIGLHRFAFVWPLLGVAALEPLAIAFFHWTLTSVIDVLLAVNVAALGLCLVRSKEWGSARAA